MQTPELTEREVDLLEILTDDLESFQLIHHSLVSEFGHRDLSVDDLMSELNELEARDLIHGYYEDRGSLIDDVPATVREKALDEYRRRLPARDHDEVAVDDVGLWYGLTEAGKRVWKERRRRD